MAPDIFNYIFINEKFSILIKTSPLFVLKDLNVNKSALVWIMTAVDADEATSLYLNQCWSILLTHHASLGLNEL